MSTLQGSVTRRVVSGSLWMIGSQAVVLALMFLAQREILSTLSKEDNGILFFQRRVVDFLMVVLVDLGMNGILIRRVVHEPDRASQILSSAFVLRMIMAAAVVSVGMVATAYSGYDPSDAAVWAVYVFISARTTLGRYVLEIPFRTTGRFRVVSALGVADAVLFTIGIWLMRHQLTPSIVIFTYAVSALPGFAVLLAARSGIDIRLRSVSPTEMMALVRESLPIVVSVALIAVHTTLDTMLVERFGTSRDVGVLGAVNAAIGPFLVIVPQTVALVLMPEVARWRDDVDRRNESVTSTLRVLIAGATCSAALAVPLLRLFVELVSAGRYSPDIEAFVWFMWTAPLVAVVVYVQELAVTLGQQQRMVTIAGILVAATAVFGFALIPDMLALGAVLSRFCTLVVGALYCIWLLFRFMAKPVDLRFAARVVLVVGGAIGTTAAAMHLVSDPWITALVAFVCAGSLSVLAGLVGAEDLRYVRARMSSRGHAP